MTPLAAVVGLRAAYGRRRHTLASGGGWEAEIAATRDVVQATAALHAAVPDGKALRALVAVLAAEDEHLRWGLAMARGVVELRSGVRRVRSSDPLKRKVRAAVRAATVTDVKGKAS